MNQPRMTNHTFDQLTAMTRAKGVSYVGARSVLVYGKTCREAAAPLDCGFQSIARAVARLRRALAILALCPHCGETIPSDLYSKKLD